VAILTTIAFRDGYLAADRQATIGNSYSETTKIRKCGRFLYGMAGPTGLCHIVGDWLADGADPSEAPQFDEVETYGFAIYRKRIYAIEGRVPMLIPLDCDVYAAGSGRDFALAAMALGKSAKEAVDLASRFDVFTGCGVDVVKVPGR